MPAAAERAEPSPRRARWRTAYGPWAVVTGASDGIGRALAGRIAVRGLDLVLVARRRAVLEEFGAALAARHGTAVRIVEADLGERAALRSVAEATEGLDVGLLVACAGFGTSGPLLDSDVAVETAMVDVNCVATLGLAHAFGRRFVRRGRGGIILMSSLLAFQGVPLAANYAATKAYVQTLAEGLRRELRPKGVDVLACAPGPVRSGFAERAGMTMGLALSAAAIAEPTLNALGRRTTVRPGWLSLLLEGSFLGQPRATRSLILGMVMRGLARRPETAA